MDKITNLLILGLGNETIRKKKKKTCFFLDRNIF